MNAFEYAIAEAAYEAYRNGRKDGIRVGEAFDDCERKTQRRWLIVARAVLDKVARYQ